MSSKKQLLDPFGTLCKLISLNFSELNTKISIQNHVLSLQKPWNYQFILRMINGDGRENISELFYAIIRVIKWYLIVEDPDSTENWAIIANCQEVKRLVRYACMALRKLQQTYEFGNVVLAIQFYINVLEDAINGHFKEEKLPQYVMELDTEYETLIDYDKLKNFWEHRKLKRVCELYDNCYKVSIDDITITEKEALIGGYLGSVNAVLEIADTEFQKLLINSNKG
jgi:hypothetical protein